MRIEKSEARYTFPYLFDETQEVARERRGVVGRAVDIKQRPSIGCSIKRVKS